MLLCISDHGSAHTESWLFGLHMKMHYKTMVNITESITEKYQYIYRKSQQHWKYYREISTYKDDHLRPLIPRIPSCIKDTSLFINLMMGAKLNVEDLLVTIDLSSLYINIPHNEGIIAINRT